MSDYTTAIEQQLLALCTWDRGACAQAAAALGPGDFEDPRHALIFETLQVLVADPATAAFDPGTLALELRRTGRLAEAGGVDYVARMSMAEVNGHKLAGLIAKVIDESARRALAAALAAQAAASRDRTFPLDAVTGGVLQAAALATKRSRDPEDAAIGAALDALLAAFEHPEADPGLPTGIPQLDELMGGLQAGHLITIAGATSSGKSSLASQIALGAAYIASRNPGRFGAAAGQVAPVLYFSYEMPREEIYLRWVSQCSSVSGSFHKGRGWLAEDKPLAIEGAHRVAGLPLYVFDHAGNTVEAVQAEVERFVVTHGTPALVIVDYIGLMQTPGITNEVQGIGHITQGLKAIARDHAIPVIEIAQINREAAGREGKSGHRPRLSDLRSSGSIENDSNIVLLIYRETSYLSDPEEKRQAEAKAVPVEINVAKNRSGETGCLTMTWLGRRLLFVPDPTWVSRFGPAVVEGHGFITYPTLEPGAGQTSEERRVTDALAAHHARTALKCPRSALLEAFGLSAKAKWAETSLLASTVDALVRSHKVLTGTGENRAVLYWLPGQFPPELVELGGGSVAPAHSDNDLDALFS